MSQLQALKKDLQSLSNPEKAKQSARFFKSGKGEYAEGDKFLGITVPDQRRIAGKYRGLDLNDVVELLQSPLHEYRLTALIILVSMFQKEDEEKRKEVVNLYLTNREYINNWDLVDISAHKILGAYLEDRDRSILYKLARSGKLWDQRIAIISTAWFISKGQLEDTFRISEILLNHEHDLIHKAVGWMLREAGKVDLKAEESFLIKHYKKMPRTMLRYAIEKFDEPKRQQYLKGEV